MLFSFVSVLLIAFSGFILTYFFADDETFLWRLCAGNIVGSAIFGTLDFIVCCFFGLTAATAGLTLLVTLAPLALLASGASVKADFARDWQAAKNRTHGTSWKKFLGFVYYAGFLLVFIIFFSEAMYQTRDGIFTGGSQNLGDLPFHLGAIYSFTDGGNFPPQNPSFDGAKFSYPFVSDLLTAFLMKFGSSIESAFLVQNVGWAFSLLVVLERFTVKTVGDRLAGKIAPVLLFFSGGLGFYYFFTEAGEQNKAYLDYLFHLPIDYTIRSEGLRWGNTLNVLFITQRSLLLGMPLTIIAFQRLWEIFAEEKPANENLPAEPAVTGESGKFNFPRASFLVGLLAGTLPLIHLHSLFALFVVAVLLFVFKPEKWLDWIAFGVGVCVVAVPELAWSLAGSASRTSEFFGWWFGWDITKNDGFVWFWFKNTGLFIPLLIAGICLVWSGAKTDEERTDAAAEKIGKQKKIGGQPEVDYGARRMQLLLFVSPFLLLFVVSNVYRFAPWQWDNIKILIYWFVGTLPFAAYALAWAYRRSFVWKIAALGCFIVLTFAGALDVWRISDGQVAAQVFDNDSIKVAEQIKTRTAPNALFLNAASYNSPVLLTGRRSLMRYSGHLSSHGIDFRPRLEDVEKMYRGDATSDILLRKYGIEYVLISPEERSAMAANEDYFRKYPIIAESGDYRVYKIK